MDLPSVPLTAPLGGVAALGAFPAARLRLLLSSLSPSPTSLVHRLTARLPALPALELPLTLAAIGGATALLGVRLLLPASALPPLRTLRLGIGPLSCGGLLSAGRPPAPAVSLAPLEVLVSTALRGRLLRPSSRLLPVGVGLALASLPFVLLLDPSAVDRPHVLGLLCRPLWRRVRDVALPASMSVLPSAPLLFFLLSVVVVVWHGCVVRLVRAGCASDRPWDAPHRRFGCEMEVTEPCGCKAG